MILRPGDPKDVEMSPQRVRHAARMAAEWVQRGEAQSLAVVVARRGTIVLAEAYGPLTPEPDAPPLRVDSIFSLASIGKVITTTALMILVDEGRVSLNRPVSAYIPEFAGEGKEHVMVWHLATHTSGLSDAVAYRHAERKEGTASIPPPEPTAHPEVHAHMWLRYDAPLARPPGTEMSYCNLGIALMGEIVRRVSGRSFHDFCQERIFGPLGMNDSFQVVPEAVRPRVVRRPADDSCAFLESDDVLEKPWMAGATFSSAMDMAIFAQMFLNGGRYGDAEILSRAAVAAMTRDQIPGVSARFGEERFEEACWGLGWGVQGSKKCFGSLQSPLTYSHGGAGGTFLWVDPAHEIVGIYFSVARAGWNNDLFMNLVTAAVR
jgi:CubicO group peptidase (beta-lactamase class C family)